MHKNIALPLIALTFLELMLPTILPNCRAAAAGLTLGSREENLLEDGQFGMYCVPDEHLTYMRQVDGSARFWVAGGATPPGGGNAVAGAIGLTTTDFSSFSPLTLLDGNAGSGISASGPGTENFDADYVGPGSVIRASNGSDLLMFYHAENHLFDGVHYDTGPFYSSIGLARSTDNGATWSRVGQVITGITPKPVQPPPGALGAAGPSVIVSGGYIYLFYIDVGNYSVFPDLVHVARASIASDGAPGTWHKYYEGTFSEPGLGGMSTPVQGQVPPDQVTHGAFWPHVNYNKCLNTFLMTFQTSDDYYYYSTSPDLVNWTLQGRISVPANFDPETSWYGYQTLISPDEDSDTVTNCTGYLYYAKRVIGLPICHSLYRRPFFFASVPATLKFVPRATQFPAQIELDGFGATSAPRFVTLLNQKTRKQNVNVAITGMDVTGDFAKSPATTCIDAITSGAKCRIGITFTPSAPGPRTGILTITTNASGSPTIRVPLTGKGRQGRIAYSPKSINFGTQSIGLETNARSVNVVNLNPVPMALAVSVDAPFTLSSNTRPPALSPNSSCSVGVTFAPTAPGRTQGALTFTDPAVGNPHSVKLTGTGR